ncbi:MAG: carboxypeptidase regulatory-like domain-containing protein [Planctomycetota bacterium]
MRTRALILLTLLVSTSTGLSQQRLAPQRDELLVAAHYYPWYTPARWDYVECATGTLRGELVPAQPAVLGAYDSSDPQVVDQHIRWSSEHGVNVWILEFIAPNDFVDQNIRNVILTHPRISDLKLSVLYDTAIRFGGDFNVTDQKIQTMVQDFDHLATHYFPHQSFLKVLGCRPVVLVYVTRALTGKVQAMIDQLRASVSAKGFDLFLVGDEFFFISPPSQSRIARFDAIFGYDVYASFGGYAAESGYLTLFRNRTQQYRATAQSLGVRFIPSCAPCFNDRAIRRVCTDHPALPPRISADADPISLFRETFGKTALENVDPELSMISITSFNEWHEDTQIEPTIAAAGTSQDTSGSGNAYTQGFVYDGTGLAYLEEIRRKVIAISGEVTDEATGEPIPGAVIEVRRGNVLFARREGFTTGKYVVPRPAVPADTYTVVARAPGYRPAKTSVVVTEDETTLHVDLSLAK